MRAVLAVADKAGQQVRSVVGARQERAATVGGVYSVPPLLDLRERPLR